MREIYQVSYKENLTASCNSNCACSQDTYEPVCGKDQKTYFSPCFAACTSLHVYTNDEGLIVRVSVMQNASDVYTRKSFFVHP